jgi:dihydropteroate synthase
VVRDGLSRSVDAALAAGCRAERLVIDPGVGFGKTVAQNLSLIRAAGRLRAEFGLPVLIGASRKRMIDAILGGRAPDRRLPGTLALHVAAALAGADVIRAHDAAEHADALRMVAALAAAPAADGLAGAAPAGAIRGAA